jgi:surface antigen
MRLTPATLGCLIGVMLAPAAAKSAELTLTPRSQTARPGQMLVMQVKTPPTGSCRLRAGIQSVGIPVALDGWVLSARISRRARRGVHTLSFSCGAGSVRARVAVGRGPENRASRGVLFRGAMNINSSAPDAVQDPADSPVASPSVVLASVALLETPQSTPFPRPVAQASAKAQEWWVANEAAITGWFRNGQCTDWAEQRRPDILRDVSLFRYDHYGPENVLTSWDARFWGILAADAGLPRSRRPAVGSVMVILPGSYGAGSLGHVAIVEAVAADGSFAVSQSHVPNVGEVTQEVFTGEQAEAMTSDPGIVFLL